MQFGAGLRGTLKTQLKRMFEDNYLDDLAKLSPLARTEIWPVIEKNLDAALDAAFEGRSTLTMASGITWMEPLLVNMILYSSGDIKVDASKTGLEPRPLSAIFAEAQATDLSGDVTKFFVGTTTEAPPKVEPIVQKPEETPPKVEEVPKVEEPPKVEETPEKPPEVPKVEPLTVEEPPPKVEEPKPPEEPKPEEVPPEPIIKAPDVETPKDWLVKKLQETGAPESAAEGLIEALFGDREPTETEVKYIYPRLAGWAAASTPDYVPRNVVTEEAARMVNMTYGIPMAVALERAEKHYDEKGLADFIDSRDRDVFIWEFAPSFLAEAQAGVRKGIRRQAVIDYISTLFGKENTAMDAFLASMELPDFMSQEEFDGLVAEAKATIAKGQEGETSVAVTLPSREALALWAQEKVITPRLADTKLTLEQRAKITEDMLDFVMDLYENQEALGAVFQTMEEMLAWFKTKTLAHGEEALAEETTSSAYQEALRTVNRTAEQTWASEAAKIARLASNAGVSASEALAKLQPLKDRYFKALLDFMGAHWRENPAAAPLNAAAAAGQSVRNELLELERTFMEAAKPSRTGPVVDEAYILKLIRDNDTQYVMLKEGTDPKWLASMVAKVQQALFELRPEGDLHNKALATYFKLKGAE